MSGNRNESLTPWCRGQGTVPLGEVVVYVSEHFVHLGP